MNRLEKIWEYLQNNLSNFGVGIVTMLVAVLAARLVYGILRNQVVKRSNQKLLWILLADVAWAAVIVAGLALAVRIAFGVDITQYIFVSAGVLSVVMGFAFKDLGENFVAGFILALNPPFKVNDYIEYKGIIGQVYEISIRAVHIITPDGKEVYIPSAGLIKNEFASLNFNGILRFGFALPLAFGFDLKRMESTVLDAVLATDGVVPAVRKLPTAHVVEVKNYETAMVQVYFWIDTTRFVTVPEHSYVRSNVIYNVLRALQAQGIALSSNAAYDLRLPTHAAALHGADPALATAEMRAATKAAHP